jgi:AcrR family transcriptional regulator
MAASKTKSKLVDVARQLFAKNGLEATTMNDIAQASDKGRRTLYTYFRSKEEIYYAVIESELERLSQRLHDVAAMNITPEEKVIELIYSHLNIVKEAVCRNGNLRAEFFRNIWVVEKVRKNFDKSEIDVMRSVLTEGNALGAFDVDDVELVADVIHYCVKGLEVPYITGRIGGGINERDSRPLVAKLVHKALSKIKKNTI